MSERKQELHCTMKDKFADRCECVKCSVRLSIDGGTKTTVMCGAMCGLCLLARLKGTTLPCGTREIERPAFARYGLTVGSCVADD